MKKFIINIIKVSLSFVIFLILTYKLIHLLLNYNFFDKKAVFIWGDSQAFQGIDLPQLKSIIGKPVYSSAHHGAGVYDLLVFSEQVPENSHVLISISKLVQIRAKTRDFNRSGLSYSALKSLYKHNYSINEIEQIIKNNLMPRINTVKNIDLYADRDSVDVSKLTHKIEEFYKNSPTYLSDKQNLYLLGVKNLIDKNCTINFVEFPLHPKLTEVENNYKIKSQLEDFKNELRGLFKECNVDSIELNNDKNIFNDATHLNSRGAKALTLKLSKKLNNNDNPCIIIFHVE